MIHTRESRVNSKFLQLDSIPSSEANPPCPRARHAGHAHAAVSVSLGVEFTGVWSLEWRGTDGEGSGAGSWAAQTPFFEAVQPGSAGLPDMHTARAKGTVEVSCPILAGRGIRQASKQPRFFFGGNAVLPGSSSMEGADCIHILKPLFLPLIIL